MNPANIDIHLLPSVRLEDRYGLPNISAVYLVFDGNDTVLYIGKAKSLTRRWMRHHRLEQFSCARAVFIAWVAAQEDEIGPLESYLIKYFRPTMNGLDIEDRERNTIGLYLTDEDRRKLQELAALTVKKSMSDVVRSLIDHAYTKFIIKQERPQ